MKKIARRFRRPTIAVIEAAKASGDKQLYNTLWRIREGQATRYACRSSASQRKKRKAARRALPHGF